MRISHFLRVLKVQAGAPTGVALVHSVVDWRKRSSSQRALNSAVFLLIQVNFERSWASCARSQITSQYVQSLCMHMYPHVSTYIHMYANVCTTQAKTLQYKLRICASVYPPSLWYFVLRWRLPFWLLASGAATAREQLKQKPAVSKPCYLWHRPLSTYLKQVIGHRPGHPWRNHKENCKRIKRVWQ